MKKEVVRSPLFYVGDKYKLIDEIQTHFPERINRLIEPFVGGGSVMMHVQAKQYIANDIDMNLIGLHKFLRSYTGKESAFFQRIFRIINDYGLSCTYYEDVIPTDMKAQFPKTYISEFNKDAYIQLKRDYNASNRTDWAMLYVLLIYGFNRILRFNSHGDFNLPVGNVDYNGNTHYALQNYFQLLRGKKITWYNWDFRELLHRVHFQPNDLVYLDPPYLITFSEYNKLWNEQTERDLLNLLDELNARNVHFALSNVINYKGRTNEILLHWVEENNYNVHPIKSNYISFHDNSVKGFYDVLICNY